MSMEVRNTRASPHTETLCLSQWKLYKTSWTGNKNAWDQTGSFECGRQFRKTEKPMIMAVSFFLQCIYRLFVILFNVDAYLLMLDGWREHLDFPQVKVPCPLYGL